MSSQINDIPLKPTKLSALQKNDDMNEVRFEEEPTSIENIQYNTNIRIKKQSKPAIKVFSCRMLVDDEKYIKQIAKNNKCTSREVIKTMIEYFRDNH